MRQDYQEYLDWTYFGDEAFDKEEFERFGDTIRGANRFIDVGASHGVYTYHANKVLHDAEIIAIEADPERFRILQGHIAEWAAESTNTIRCVHAAASDETDRQASPEVTFYTTGTQISGGLFSVSERSNDYAPVSVPLVCVDDYFVPDSQTFVKIDVEGAELRVLKGAIRHVESGNTRFFTEISWWGDRPRGTSALSVLQFCFQHGLRVDHRLGSNFMLEPEPDASARLWSIIRCLRPVGLRFTFNAVVPERVRTWRERRGTRRRMARYARSR